jgi:hypothetical protein
MHGLYSIEYSKSWFMLATKWSPGHFMPFRLVHEARCWKSCKDRPVFLAGCSLRQNLQCRFCFASSPFSLARERGEIYESWEKQAAVWAGQGTWKQRERGLSQMWTTACFCRCYGSNTHEWQGCMPCRADKHEPVLYLPPHPTRPELFFLSSSKELTRESWGPNFEGPKL